MTNDPHSSSSDPRMSSASGFLQSLLGSVRPPEWAVNEVQNRVVLFLNHVLMQEPEARARLRRQQGKPVKLQWGELHLTLCATTAGLLERPTGETQPELDVVLTQTSPWGVAQRLLAGEKPGVDIRGDVQLAAEVAWLVDNVRWDVEEDISRFLGDAAAHTLVGVARRVTTAVKGFAGRTGEAGASRHRGGNAA